MEWKTLPYAGGLLDQDDALMQDLSTWNYVHTLIRGEKKA